MSRELLQLWGNELEPGDVVVSLTTSISAKPSPRFDFIVAVKRKVSGVVVWIIDDEGTLTSDGYFSDEQLAVIR